MWICACLPATSEPAREAIEQGNRAGAGKRGAPLPGGGGAQPPRQGAHQIVFTLHDWHPNLK